MPFWWGISPMSANRMSANRFQTRKRGKRNGFTLIEILIALAIFAIMSMIAYQGLSRMMRTKEHLDAQVRYWRELTLMMGRFEEDISQIVDRSWRDDGGTLQPAVRGAAGPLDRHGAQLEMVRLDGGKPVHIGYRVSNGHLDLLVWQALDQAPRTEPQVYKMMDGIQAMQVRFNDGAGQWQFAWPNAGQTQTNERLPHGIELKLVLKDGQTISRLVSLR
ncbi:type II secretion system minor pseudopilin GspJ [Burkholderiaceae bacterium DAT-1]|nr:type II secretion system minor pseudopilin GspJ [Burkholderiaceae bacterium DAT-1]